MKGGTMKLVLIGLGAMVLYNNFGPMGVILLGVILALGII